MKQKYLFLGLIAISWIFTPVNAQKIAVSAIDEISTMKPAHKVSVKLLEPLVIKNEQILSSDVILTGELTNIKQPRRLKRDAQFTFVPTEYTQQENEHKISNIKAKYTKKLSKKEISKKAALGVGNYFVKGLSSGVALVEGAIKNEEGNRIKSSAKSVYEASPLAYLKKGSELDIKPNECFYLNFTKVKNGNR
ncbi:hypothetical protein IKR55_05240 [bacterium]|nr:hypothetical protein [bacterium]